MLNTDKFPEYKPERKQEWKDETNEWKFKAKEFLQIYYQKFYDGEDSRKKGYDHFEEMHISGGGPDILAKVKKGEITPSKIQVLYQDNYPKKMHVIFSDRRLQENTEYYLEGRALAHFLAFAER